ncbi:MAG TPA: HAMP domain-containing sensor histidine kinase, partial [Coriobacteriia bacterium]
ANLTLAEAFDGIRLTGEDGVGVHPDDLTGSAFDEPTPVLLESPGGEARWLVWQATRYTDAVHERVILTGRDVTEEQRLQKLRAEIVSLISHDLRSPLAVVVGYLDLLRRPLPNDERERAIAAAKRNAGKMAELLEDLLTAARAEELLGPSAFSPVSLADLAEEVVGSLAPTHPERELRLDLQCRPIVRGEARRLRQAIVNLVTNALKYSPDHEPITVRVACEQARAVLFVIDGGPGVQESERDRVFQRFARVDKVAAERPGVGLGLYIVRTICENHGGHAQARETPGGGATFVIDLPCTGRVDDVGLVDCEGVAAPV